MYAQGGASAIIGLKREYNAAAMPARLRSSVSLL